MQRQFATVPLRRNERTKSIRTTGEPRDFIFLPQILSRYTRPRLSTMYFPTIIVTTALFGTFITMAVPGSKRETKRATPRSGLESQPQCCAVGVLGIVDIQCADRTLSLSLSNCISGSRTG